MCGERERERETKCVYRLFVHCRTSRNKKNTYSIRVFQMVTDTKQVNGVVLDLNVNHPVCYVGLGGFHTIQVNSREFV